MRLAVLEASPNAIVAVDERARIQYVNSRARKAFGYAHDELVGRPIEILVPDEHAHSHVVERDAYLADPVPRPMGVARDPLGRRKDGSVFPIEAAVAAIGEHVMLAVDDAGAGFASLRHILELRPTFAKLDISLVRGIDMDEMRQSLAAGLNYYGLRTGCRLIAEGVETQAEADTLLDLGIEFGQGYLLGRPARLQELSVS